MIEISVIIPCRGHAPELKGCLASLVQQAAPFQFEVIVVDSAADDLVASTTQEFTGVTMVRGTVPLTAGGARNHGVAVARGNLVAFIDADCVAEGGWLARCRQAMLDPAVRIAGGPVLDLYPHRWIAAADNRLQFADSVATRKPGAGHHFPACNIVVRRHDLLALGGFSEIAGGEDVLLCNAVLARWPGGLRFEPGMQVRHAGRSTWEAYLTHQESFGYSRAVSRLHIEPWHVRLGRRRAAIPLIVAKRLSYLISAGFRHGGVGKTLLLAPLLIPGLWRYGVGFVRGCRESTS